MDDEGSQSSNVKGKGPETSASATSSDVLSRPESRVFGTMQSEPPPQGRLGSVKTERMTLGGATKMKFKPTIPPKRNKKEGAPSLLEDTMSKAKDESADRGKGKGRGRGRGRGRDHVEEVVASGPFSLGPAAALNAKSTRPYYISSGGSGGGGGGGSGSGSRRGSGSAGGTKDGSTSSSMAILTLDGHEVKTTDPMSIDEESGDLDMQFGDGTDPWAPVTLPREVKVKKEKEKEKGKSKQARNQRMQDDEIDVKEKVKVKDEPMAGNVSNYDDLLDDDDSLDILAAKMLEGANEAFDSSNHNISDDHLLFFQFPAILPKFETESSATARIDLDPEPIKAETSTAAGQTNDSAMNADVKEEKDKEALMQNEPEGHVGKLLVYKSGKVKIRFGGIVFEVYPGSDVSFLENVVVVDPNAKQAFVMGNISKRFVCVPDMSCLLKN